MIPQQVELNGVFCGNMFLLLPTNMTTFIATTIIKLLLYCCVFSHNPVPSAPQNVTGEQLNATAVRLHWDPPESPNGVVTGYQVTYYGYSTTAQVQQVYYLCR